MSKWGFVLSAAKNKLSSSKPVYGAHIRHQDVVRGEELYKEISQYLAINPTMAESLVTGLGGFIQSKLQHGYKLDFGVFKVGLTLRGGFAAVNEELDPKRNSVSVSFVPGAKLKKAVAGLRPQNLTTAVDPVLQSVYCLKEGAKKSVVICRETMGANGRFPAVDFRGDGDGVWLESADGTRIADATIRSADVTRIDFVFDQDIPAGKYQLVVGFHNGVDTAIATDGLPVKVVPSALR